MAPSKPHPANNANPRVNTMLDLARRLEHALSSRAGVSSTLSNELTAALDRTDAFSMKASTSTVASQLDKLGCSVWNASIRIDCGFSDKSDDETRAMTRLISYVRGFAFTLLAAAVITPASKDDTNCTLRLFKTALKATQSALSSEQTDLALRLLERCSDYAGETDNSAPVVNTIESEDYSLESQNRFLIQIYLLLRVEHAKLCRNSDLAEHFLRKVDRQHVKRSIELTEKAACLCHDLGLALAIAGEQDSSRAWLLKALECINACTVPQLQKRIHDLRLSITTRLVRQLLSLHEERANHVAWDLAMELTTKHGIDDCLHIVVLELDVLLAIEPLRRDLLGQTAMRLTMSDLNDGDLEIISRAINKIKIHDRGCAEQILRRLTQRQSVLSASTDDSTANQGRLERCLVTYTHFLSSEGSSQTSSLSLLFDDVSNHMKGPLSTAATHAIQSLLWRAISSETAPTNPDLLRALQHKILFNCSNANRARIQRKAILASLHAADSITARQVYFEMSPHCQSEALSQYIGFRIALQSDDHTWAARCLQDIAKQTTDDQSLLYACALEAQQSSKQVFAIESLSALVNSTPLASLTPSLLRCLARLLLTNYDVTVLPNNVLFAQFMGLFDQFVQLIEARQEDLDGGWQDECQWWSKHAHNLSLTCINTSSADHSVPLLKACMRILSRMLSGERQAEREATTAKLQTCHYIVATILISNARKQTDDEPMLQRYLEARQEIQNYFKLDHPQVTSTLHEPRRRSSLLRRYELEAIIRLKQWQDLQLTIAKCLAFDVDAEWNKLADLALILHKELAQVGTDFSIHAPDALELLQKSLNELWKKEKNIKQVARWLRTAFAIDLSINQGVSSNSHVTLKLLDQAAALASRGAQGLTNRYPSEELQWLASASFNHGVDHGINGGQQIAWQLFDAALELARYADDNGALHASLTARREEASKKMKSN
ncbi:hypothetical protein AMS68_002785 [Peltaster fructicola]|uniref:Protein ZIP4 homolog n=1 Tax=Peltaster fructicola TaxID=286661 RepID=A0A6H0XRK1_9PEZI|nr:hypothetical protein AMS68_002785 [Peltaster fructicola]